MTRVCPSCDAPLVVKLMSDYASSGLWCAACGVSFANPFESPGIPVHLAMQIDEWNLTWELANDAYLTPLGFAKMETHLVIEAYELKAALEERGFTVVFKGIGKLGKSNRW